MIFCSLWGPETAIILSCLTNLKINRQDIDAFQVTLLLGPSDRWTVQLLERSTEISVLCMEPDCLLVFFDFILQLYETQACHSSVGVNNIV